MHGTSTGGQVPSGGGAASAAPAAAAGGAAPAAAEEEKEEKKEEKVGFRSRLGLHTITHGEQEESDDDMGFGLFD